MYHQVPHTVDCHKAQAYIMSHGHHAAITADGLLATSVGMLSEDPSEGLPRFSTVDLFNKALEVGLTGDFFVDDATVFPIDDNGRVATKAIRDWLGY